MYYIANSYSQLTRLIDKHGCNIIVLYVKEVETLLLTCYEDGDKSVYCNLFGCAEHGHKHKKIDRVFSYHTYSYSPDYGGAANIFAMNYVELTPELLQSIEDDNFLSFIFFNINNVTLSL